VEKDLEYNLGMSFSKIRVAVLRGGPSNEYDASLKTGAHVLSLLREMPGVYEPVDIFISKDGEWHLSGLVRESHKALDYTDVVWNALHGSYGADGQVQRLLEELKIPFTGSGAVASALALNNDMARRLYREYSLLTPSSELITKDILSDDLIIDIFRNYLLPVIVKPANAQRSFGPSLAFTFRELKEKISETLQSSPRVLVEEFVKGDEISCAVVENVKGEKIHSLSPIIKYKSKFKTEENKEVEEVAKRAHAVLGLSHYSNSDFIITPKKNIYILETRSLPLLHRDSLMHYSLGVAGWHPREFVDHVIKLAL